PGIVFGTNGRVAWTGTNVEGDVTDLVRCVPADRDTLTFEGPHGPMRFGVRREVLRVRGAPPETLRVRTTPWGPVVGRSARGGLVAAQGVPPAPAASGCDLLGWGRAPDVPDLSRRLDPMAGPPLNFVAGDSAGHIGFRIAGAIPRRHGYDPARPREATWAD